MQATAKDSSLLRVEDLWVTVCRGSGGGLKPKLVVTAGLAFCTEGLGVHA